MLTYPESGSISLEPLLLLSLLLFIALFFLFVCAYLEFPYIIHWIVNIKT
jgi:hypothetical protein